MFQQDLDGFSEIEVLPEELVHALIAASQAGEPLEPLLYELAQDYYHGTGEESFSFFSVYLFQAILNIFHQESYPITCILQDSKGSPITATFTGKSRNNAVIFAFPDNADTALFGNAFFKHFRAYDTVCSSFVVQSWNNQQLTELIRKVTPLIVPYIDLRERLALSFNPDNLAVLDQPLEDIVAAFRMTNQLQSRTVINELREQKMRIMDVLQMALPLIENCLAQPNSDVDSVIDVLEEQGIFRDLPKPVEITVREMLEFKLGQVFKQRSTILAYREKYESMPWYILCLHYKLPASACEGQVEARWGRDSMTFIVEQEAFEALEEKIYGIGKVGLRAGWAEIRGTGINVVKKYDEEALAMTIRHEERHQKNRFLLHAEGNVYSVKAQDEIIAFADAGNSVATILSELTCSEGIYNYFATIKGAHHPLPIDAVKHEQEWFMHCRRIFKGVQTLVAGIHGGHRLNFDHLAMIPMSRWSELFDIPTEPNSQNFFLISTQGASAEALIDSITQFLLKPEHAHLIGKAGLGAKEELGAVIFSASDAIITLTESLDQSGILGFIVNGEVEVYIAPSLKEIREHIQNKLNTRN